MIQIKNLRPRITVSSNLGWGLMPVVDTSGRGNRASLADLLVSLRKSVRKGGGKIKRRVLKHGTTFYCYADGGDLTMSIHVRNVRKGA